MKFIISLLRAYAIASFLLACSQAQEAKEDLFKQAQGYWIVDLDSQATKGLILKVAREGDEQIDEEGMQMLLKEMASSTFEIREDRISFHDPNSTEETKVKVKSQNLAEKSVEAILTFDGEDPKPARILVMGDRLTLSINEDGELLEFGLARVDKEIFQRRMAELDQLKLKAGAEGAGLDEDLPQPELVEAYPLGIPVPGRPGFVFSPYNRQVIDVRELPAGTLVQDPTFPADERKFFRVP